jgi:hypothetical protein
MRFILCSFLLAVLPALAPAREPPMLPGLVVLDSVRGELTITSGGEPVEPRRHARLPARELTLALAPAERGHATFVLSNGLTLCLGPGTRLTLKELVQEPFEITSSNRDMEPSPSRLRLSLEAGSLTCAHRPRGDRPSSRFAIETPSGTFEVDARHLVIEMADPPAEGLTAYVITGSARFTPAGSEIPKTILSLQRLLVDPDAPNPAELADYSAAELDRLAPHLLMARRSSERVLYTGEGEGEAWRPVPRIVLPAEFFE